MLTGADVRWCGKRFFDPSFRTFEYEGTYYKATLSGASGWPSNTSAPFFLEKMANEGFIPPTWPSELQMDRFGQIYQQQTEYFSVHLRDADILSWQEAAVLFLKFNLWLEPKGFGLLDGHASNIVFQNAMQPKWCDLGSIVPLANSTPFLGIDEFIRYYVYPLLLRAKSPCLGATARSAATTGISHELAGLLLPDLALRLPSNRKELLLTLLDSIEKLRFPEQSTTWSDYHADAEFQSDRPRHQILARLLAALQPRQVVDIGANAGFFSRYIASQGAEVLAVEPDETAVLHHHRRLRATHFSRPLKLLLASIGQADYRPGDLAVALALTHHLFFTERFPWKYTVKLLASYTTRNLLTEFMPHGMSGCRAPESLPDNYTIDIFSRHLERYFQSVRVIDYEPGPGKAPRRFLLCRDKRPVPIDDGWGDLPWD